MLSVLAGNTVTARKTLARPAVRGQLPAEDAVFFLADEAIIGQQATVAGFDTDPEEELE